MSEGLLRWISFVERTPDLPIGFIMSRAAVTDWPEAVLAAYEAPFPDQAHKTGARQFPLIVPLDPDTKEAAQMSAVRDALAAWDRPAAVIFSTEDAVFQPEVGERFVKLIPGADELVLIENAGHYLQEDQGEAVAEEILRFLDRT